MKIYLVYLLSVLLLSSCVCDECFVSTLSPQDLEGIATANAIQSNQLPLSEEKPNLICIGDFEANEWIQIQEMMREVNVVFGEEVATTQINLWFVEGKLPFEALELIQYPACLIFNDMRQEMLRFYDGFSIDTVENLLRELITSP